MGARVVTCIQRLLGHHWLDLGPLGCIACVAIGEWKAKFNGKIMPGKEAMKAAGVNLMHLNAKEGLSLINGTSGMVGLACKVITEATNTLKNSAPFVHLPV